MIYQDPTSMEQLSGKTLIQKILDASNYIENNIRKGSGDFIITNSKVADVINEYNIKEEKRILRKKKLDSL